MTPRQKRTPGSHLRSISNKALSTDITTMNDSLLPLGAR